jgi:hypothetical protein
MLVGVSSMDSVGQDAFNYSEKQVDHIQGRTTQKKKGYEVE